MLGAFWIRFGHKARQVVMGCCLEVRHPVGLGRLDGAGSRLSGSLLITVQPVVPAAIHVLDGIANVMGSRDLAMEHLEHRPAILAILTILARLARALLLPQGQV